MAPVDWFWQELSFSPADDYLLAVFWQVLFSVHAWEEETISLSYKDTNPIGSRAYIYDFVHVCILISFSCVLLCVSLWTVAHKVLCPWDSPGRLLEWVVIPPQGMFPTQEWTCVSYFSCIGRQVLYWCLLEWWLHLILIISLEGLISKYNHMWSWGFSI